MRQGLESRGLLRKESQAWGPHLTALLTTQAPRCTLSQVAGLKVPVGDKKLGLNARCYAK